MCIGLSQVSRKLSQRLAVVIPACSASVTANQSIEFRRPLFRLSTCVPMPVGQELEPVLSDPSLASTAATGRNFLLQASRLRISTNRAYFSFLTCGVNLFSGVGVGGGGVICCCWGFGLLLLLGFFCVCVCVCVCVCGFFFFYFFLGGGGVCLFVFVLFCFCYCQSLFGQFVKLNHVPDTVDTHFHVVVLVDRFI